MRLRTIDTTRWENLRQVDLPSGKVYEYLIDGRNRRVAERIYLAGEDDPDRTRLFVYWDQLNPAGMIELDDTGVVTSRSWFVYGSRAHVPDLVVRLEGVFETVYRVLTDQVGSVRYVVDATSGLPAQTVEYDAFGRVTANLGDVQPFGFAGGLWTPETGVGANSGMVRFGARDYEPVLGRWTAKDPIRFAGGDTTLYGYVLNDPVMLHDTSGLSPCSSLFFPYSCEEFWQNDTDTARDQDGDRYAAAARADHRGWGSASAANSEAANAAAFHAPGEAAAAASAASGLRDVWRSGIKNMWQACSNFSNVAKRVSQKQYRHIKNRREWANRGRGGYLEFDGGCAIGARCC